MFENTYSFLRNAPSVYSIAYPLPVDDAESLLKIDEDRRKLANTPPVVALKRACLLRNFNDFLPITRKDKEFTDVCKQ